MRRWEMGDRVEGGDTVDTYDTGRVIAVHGDGTVTVAWDSEVQTPADAASLRAEGDAPVLRCACSSCGCEEHATTTDDAGVDVCDVCADYYTTDDGEVVCSRTQDETICHYCCSAIDWGVMQVPASGSGCSMTREGTCECEGRTWTQSERGGAWQLAEVES